MKTNFTFAMVSAGDIFSRFKALKLSEGLSQFKCFKTRGYDFKMVLAIQVSMVVSSDKTVNPYHNSHTGEGSSMGKDAFYRLMNSPFICRRMLTWHLAIVF